MQDCVASDCIILDGGLTMRAAEALCTRLRAAIEEHSHVLIDCTSADEVDLTFVQLLIAARLSARESDKTVALASSPSGAFLATLTRAGFCVTHEEKPGGQQAFWFEGAVA